MRYVFFIKKGFLTNLVALTKGYRCGNNEKLLVRSRSGDVDIIVPFMLYYSGSNIFLDTRHGEARKIMKMCYQEYMLFLVTNIFQVFSGKARGSSGKHN